MNNQKLKEAKETFNLAEVLKAEKENEVLRKEFVKDFDRKSIADMTIDDYIVGKKSTTSFCYRLEYDLDCLGRIHGRGSSKFGVWYSLDDAIYQHKPKFGNNYKTAFNNVKKAILEIIDSGAIYDKEAIIANKLDAFVKGKILSVYYPDKYLNIFSSPHLDYFLTTLNCATDELLKRNVIYKREAMIDFKNHDKDMKKWSLQTFSTFIYGHYPKAPTKDNGVSSSSNQKDLELPPINPDDIEFVNLTLDPNPIPNTSRKSSNIIPPRDYGKEAKRNKELGTKGEDIAYKAEINRLKNSLSISMDKAEKMVEWKADKSDSFGYDILSKNDDGTNRYIEVKATQGNVGNMEFYYTQYELETAKKFGKDYFIYIVYNILTTKPKIWILPNPFIQEDKLELQPIKYKVQVRIK